ncbi:hypothetical protein QQG55_34065 [Brugia pahangi]
MKIYLIIIVLSIISIKLIFGLKCYQGVTTEYFHSPISFKIKTCQVGNFCIKYHHVDFRYRQSFTIKSCDDSGICMDESCAVGSVAAKFMGYMRGPLYKLYVINIDTIYEINRNYARIEIII